MQKQKYQMNCIRKGELEQKEIFNNLVIDMEKERSVKASKIRQAEVEGMAEAIVTVLECSYIRHDMAVDILDRAVEMLGERLYE